MSQIPQHGVAHVLAYDVGGSHVSAAVCEEGAYTLRGISRAPLPESSHFSAASFCRLIHTLGEAAAAKAGIPIAEIAGASLALPGPFDYEHGISLMQHKLQSLYQFDLKAALAARFHWQPAQLRFVNDAAAFTLGEAGAGAAMGQARVLGLTLGTGIGAAFAVDRKIAESGPGNPDHVPEGGELWNQPYNGATVEDFVSTRYLRHHFEDLAGSRLEVAAEVSEIAAIAECQDNQPCQPLADLAARQAQASGLNPQPAVSAQVTTQLAASARLASKQAFQDFGRHLGLALNLHAADFQPDMIVMGGGIARASSLFLPATRQTLNFSTTLAISTLMDEAPLAGAAVHWFTNP